MSMVTKAYCVFDKNVVTISKTGASYNVIGYYSTLEEAECNKPENGSIGVRQLNGTYKVYGQ